jgi:hypothetical protein
VGRVAVAERQRRHRQEGLGAAAGRRHADEEPPPCVRVSRVPLRGRRLAPLGRSAPATQSLRITVLDRSNTRRGSLDAGAGWQRQ